MDDKYLVEMVKNFSTTKIEEGGGREGFELVDHGEQTGR